MRKILIVTVAVALTVFAGAAKADTIDLTYAGAPADSLTATVGGTAYFSLGAILSGTGRFPAFVQVGGNTDVVEGYNTTVNNTNDNGPSDTFNYEITVGSLNEVTYNGGQYYEFLLDINETDTASDRYLSLDDLQVLTSTVPNQSSEPLPTGTARWIMNAEDLVLLNYTLNTGSGKADMVFLVPTASFAGALSTDYVYLYSKFGEVGVVGDRDYGNSDGFEEWAYIRSTVSVPDGGATALLLGLSMLGLGVVRRFRR